MEDQTNDSTSTPAVKQPQVGAVMATEKGAENKKGQVAEAAQSPSRTYSEDEWNKRQSSFDKQVSKTNERLQELERQSAEATVKVQEAQYNNWLAAIEDSGGDVDAAGKAIAGIKQSWSEANKILAQKAQIEQQAAILEEAGKGKKASDLIKEHGLEESAVEQLMDSKDSTEMELKALKLKVAQTAVTATPPKKVDSGLGDGKKTDLSAQPASEALGRLMEEALEK